MTKFQFFLVFYVMQQLSILEKLYGFIALNIYILQRLDNPNEY